jgi:A/G-specific adenine glycosylase
MLQNFSIFPENLHAPVAQSVTSKINVFIYDATIKMRTSNTTPKLATKLIAWYAANRRDLPWRPPLGKTDAVDPYFVLVSEFMLQQTQVATVLPYFNRFIKAFPTIASLAKAPEQEVLRLWQGLGYYSRARNLQAAAQKIITDYRAQIPTTAEELQSLPGVGRYTAGAIASIAFGCRSPILDGNVARVLSRLENIDSDPRDPATRARLWQIAEDVLPTKDCGQFNSALMELGATICTPRRPRCLACPIRQFCKAAAAGTQESIPAPRKSRPVPTSARWTFCIHHKNRWLIERRPTTGRWPGLWQFPTIEAEDSPPEARKVSGSIGLTVTDLTLRGQVRHTLTHRRYLFTAFSAQTRSTRTAANRKWITLDELDQFALSRPQLRIAELLKGSPDGVEVTKGNKR